ncbi:DNA topoisomerase I [Corynebacterium resistens DSM 45100]|uniref:DNA topoisomerase 1 n=1 Tax=Corynebacterium resistens (strain DSM 45100 / JCM 12819 / GTC 2026 / SICGH 158) TaxID=662755 RepID=F8E391_CORRG|nr:type I DNA topoisomerase [Corynebacterium resistens]AEI10363.1 DNA topoisomerase I [Corynebacterium resistens DSM 45100]
MAKDDLKRLVIVESATKARKIAPYLGPNYIVEASVGHIRDLPRGAADVPAKYKKEPWARLGVNVDKEFEPLYVVSADKKKKVSDLKAKLKQVDELYLATDPDREGEAIAWHLLEVLKPKVPVRRMVFHEITKPAILAAAEDTRELDQDLVDAQEARRVLDRLYGYEVSPVLWKKVMPRLSAGRVQSVATRVIVERERERMAFVSAEYWDLTAKLNLQTAGLDGEPNSFEARLATVGGKRVAQGRDFNDDGQLKSEAVVLDGGSANALATDLTGSDMQVTGVEEKPYTRRPYPPFMTSTLQQEAARKLRFTSERTMRIAQRLYENGHITYMRTDSTTLSQSGMQAARAQAKELYGAKFVANAPRQYNRKVKNSQEAHEAIRPAGETFDTPGQLAGKLDAEEYKLYELIWQRTVASQMADAKGMSMKVTVAGSSSQAAEVPGITSTEVEFTATGRTLTFPGFLKAYVEVSSTGDGKDMADNAEKRLPVMSQGDALKASEVTAEGHTTNPPARYNEASLVKRMEELGIGRPSTYASIIRTIQDRGYVLPRGNALVPSWVAFAVVGLLEQNFGSLVDYDFTSAMEDELDAIAEGRTDRANWLRGFYFGDDSRDKDSPSSAIPRQGGLQHIVGDNLEQIDARRVNSLHLFDDAEGNPIVVRVGRYGPYLERVKPVPAGAPEGTEPEVQRANLPESMTPDGLTLDVAEKLFATPQGGRELGVNPESGRTIVAREGRYGPYVTELLGEDEEAQAAAKAEAQWEAERDEQDREREAEGKKPLSRETKTAQNQKAKRVKELVEASLKPKTASLFSDMEPASVTLEEALKLMSLPREVGVDPSDGEMITAQNGRFGPYLKKGSDSRSLANEEQIFTVTLDEARRIYAEPKRRGRAAAKPPLKQLGDNDVSGKPMSVKEGRFGAYVTDGTTNASLRKGDTPETITDARANELLSERRAKMAAEGTAPAKSARKAAKKSTRKTSAKKTTKKAGAKKTGTKKSTKKAPPTLTKRTVKRSH